MSPNYSQPIQFIQDEESDTICCPTGETMKPYTVSSMALIQYNGAIVRNGEHRYARNRLAKAPAVESK